MPAYTLKRNTAALTTAGTFYSNGTNAGSTDSTVGWVNVSEMDEALVVLKVTNADTDAGDTLDVYIDGYVEGVVVNLIHFTQIVGTASATTYAATLTDKIATTTIVDVTSDAAAGTQRALGYPEKIRARWVMANTGTVDLSMSFGIYVSGV